MSQYKVSRWLRNGNVETAFHETKHTTSLKRAKEIYDKWEKDPLTTRLCIWETQHGCTTAIMTMNPRKD